MPTKNNNIFVDYCNYWLISSKSLELEKSTFDSYENIINVIKKYDIADIQMSDLTTEHFRSFLAELAEKYSLGSIKKTWNIVKQVVELAENENKIKPRIIRKINLPKENNVAVKKKVVPLDRNVLKNGDGTAKYDYIKKDPKTEKSTRTIPLPNRAIEVLQFLEKEAPNHKK